MAFAITPVAAKDGAGTTISGGVDFIDTSGTGAGPWIITKVGIDPAGTNTQAILSNSAAKTDLSSVAGVTTATGHGTAAAALRVELPTDSTGVIGVTDNAGSLTVDNGGTFAVQAAQSGTWNVTNVSGTVSLPTGASTSAKQPALGTAGTASSDVITIQGVASMTKLLVTPDSVALPANQSVNVAQVNGVTTLMGNGTTGTGSQRVTIASDNTAFSVNAAATQSGTWTVQPGNTANTTAWKVDGSAVTQPISGTVAIGAGSAVIGHVIVDSGGGGGTQYTEDAVSAADPVGGALNLVRNDARTGSITSTDGDNIAARGTNSGELYVKHVDAIPVTDNSGSLTVDNGGTFAVQATLAAGAAAIAKAEDVASADADVGVPAMMVRKATPANTSGTDGDYEMLQGSAGRLWVDPSGVTLTVASHAVTNAGTFAVQAACAGDTASAATDAGNPVKVGAVGKTANPTAVTDGQRVNFIADKLGKQIVVGAIRDLKGVTQTQISNSTSETTIVAAVASTFNDLYGLILANTGATTTKVTIKDDTAGTTRMIFEVPTLETRGFMVPVDSAVPQATVNKNWTATCASATTAMEVTALWVKNI